MKNRHLFPLFIVLIFSLLASVPLFQPGLFSGHDIWHNLARFYHYTHSVTEGNIPPYWIPTLSYGYGYPLFFFSFPLPWIIGLTLTLAGLSIPVAFKALLFISILISGLTMYYFCYSLTNQKIPALLAAILYIWAPFHFLNLYVSVAVGVLFAFSFLPLLFQGLYLLTKKTEAKLGLILTGVGLAAIVLSHLISMIFTFPLILTFLGWLISKQKGKMQYLYFLILSILLGLLLSSFYLIPAAYYSSLTAIKDVGGFSEIFQHNFVNLKQIIYSPWGFSPIVNDAREGQISLQLGLAQWLGILLSLGLVLTNKISKKFKSLVFLLLIILIINIFFMLEYSLPIWKFLIELVSLDYPFRLLLPVTFIAALLGGLAIANVGKKVQIALFITLVVIALYANRNHVKTNMVTATPYMDLIAGEITTNTFNEYRPKFSNPRFFQEPGPKVVPENLKISNITQSYKELSFNLEATQSTKISIGHLDFPGITVYSNDVRLPHLTDKQGRVSTFIPAGIQRIKVQFEQTPVIIISKLLTILGLVITMVLLITVLRRSSIIDSHRDSFKKTNDNII